MDISGGESLARRLNEIAKSVTTAATVKIGFLENAKYPDGTSVALVAALNEFGVPAHGQPPRPAFRNMVKAKSPEWPAAVAKLLKANDYDAKRTLDQAGMAIVGQLRQSIVDITDPPLAPATIARKGFDKPWIETAHLLNSVDHEVT
jgi:hypothetical protein